MILMMMSALSVWILNRILYIEEKPVIPAADEQLQNILFEDA